MNKTKQMAARRTEQRRRARCPLLSRSRLALNELSGFFFFYLIFFPHLAFTRSNRRMARRFLPGASCFTKSSKRQSLVLLCCWFYDHIFHLANSYSGNMLIYFFVLLVTQLLTLTPNIVCNAVTFSLFKMLPNFAETRTSIRCSTSTCCNYLE